LSNSSNMFSWIFLVSLEENIRDISFVEKRIFSEDIYFSIFMIKNHCKIEKENLIVPNSDAHGTRTPSRRVVLLQIEPVSHLWRGTHGAGRNHQIRYWSKTSSKSNWVALEWSLFWVQDKLQHKNELTATSRVIFIIVQFIPQDYDLASVRRACLVPLPALRPAGQFAAGNGHH